MDVLSSIPLDTPINFKKVGTVVVAPSILQKIWNFVKSFFYMKHNMTKKYGSQRETLRIICSSRDLIKKNKNSTKSKKFNYV